MSESETLSEREALLDDLLFRWEAALQHGRDLDPATLCDEAGCPELRERLEREVAKLRAIGAVLDTSSVPGSVPDATPGSTETGDPAGTPNPRAPASFGDYDGLTLLGQGGMGVVYRARQVSLNRYVAIKMIKDGERAGLDDLIRFRGEAEAVASLDHPNIIQVYDIGMVDGSPFFSMKLIDGVPLARVLDRYARRPADAAALMIKIAEALAHAHRRGILHRDLKPSNIILDDAGEPFVSDFGLAKRLTPTGGVTTLSAGVVGTPAYMAPEQLQARAEAITTATDIYGLGTILYGMLTRRQPFAAASDYDLYRKIIEAEPDSPTRWNPLVDRSLACICLKCLSKDPKRRYGSAEALVEDLRRWQNHQPIEARPIRTTTRLLMWCRRRPLVAGSLAAFALTVVVGVTAITWAWRDALEQKQKLSEQTQKLTAEKARAVRLLGEKETALHERGLALKAKDLERREAKKFADFMGELFDASESLGVHGYSLRGPSEVGGDLTARELLDRGAARLVENGANYEPLLRAALLRSIGNSYRSMVLPEKAEPLLREALAIYRAHPESDPVELAESLLAYGWYLHDRFEPDEALACYREAYELFRANLGEDDEQTVRCKFHVGWLLADIGEVDEAERLLREAIATLKRPGHGRRDLAIAELGLVSVLIDNFREVEALPWLLDANRTLGSEGLGDSFFQALKAFQAGYTFRKLNLLGRSEQELQRSLDIATGVVGDQHPYLAFILHESAMTKLALGKAIEAEESFRRAYRIVERNRYLGHPRAHRLVVMLSDLLQQQGNRREAAELFDVMLDARRRRYPGKAEWIADGLVQRAWSRPGLTPAQVEAETDEALRLYAAAPESHINFLPEALQLKIKSLMVRGDYAHGEEVCGRLLGLDLSRYPLLDQNQIRAWARTHRGVCLARLGRFEEAEADLGQAMRVLRGPDLALPLEGSIVMELQRRDPGAAAALAHRWRELPPRNALDSYSLAASLLRCANVAGDSELGHRCQAEAVEALGDAVARGYSDLAQFRRDFGPLGDVPEVRALELTLLDRAFPADAPFAEPEEPFATDRSYDLVGGAAGGAIARLVQVAEGRWSFDHRDQSLLLREVERTPYAITFEPEGEGPSYRVLSNGILLRAEKGRWVRLPLRMARWRGEGDGERPR